MKIAADKEKSASGEGSPDRMTVSGGDGEGGITASPGTIPTDSGEAEVKRDQPANGTIRTSEGEPSGSPDRMTVSGGDGEGGITTSPGTIPKDSGEGDVKTDQPANGETRKSASASERILRIRKALGKGPAAAPAQTKAAGNEVKPNTDAGLSANMSQETLAKIASIVLSTDEGVQFAHNLIEKQAGESAARQQIDAAIKAANSYDESEIIKSAAFDSFSQNLRSIDADLTQIGVGEAEAGMILKQAAVHQNALNSFDHPLLKQAYAEGMDDAALLSEADAAAGEEGVPPMDEAMPMGGEELGEEEIIALLQEMIETGEITEEDVIAALAEEGGGEMMGGEMPPEEAAAAPMEEALPAM